jgi:hypothetical protein
MTFWNVKVCLITSTAYDSLNETYSVNLWSRGNDVMRRGQGHDLDVDAIVTNGCSTN